MSYIEGIPYGELLLISKLMKMSRAQAAELRELIEDVVEHFCDQHQLSGESTWTAVETLSVAKYVCFAGAVHLT